MSAWAATARDQQGALPVLSHSRRGERDEEIQAPIVYRLANVLGQQSRQNLTLQLYGRGLAVGLLSSEFHSDITQWLPTK